MTPQETGSSRRFTNRTLLLAAAGLWIAAAALAALFLLTGGEAGAEKSVTTTTSAPATTSTTLPPTTSTSATSTTTTVPATTTTTLPPSLTIAAGGDVMGDRGVAAFIRAHGAPAVLAKVKPFLADAQLAFVNLECPISDKGTAQASKEYTFRAPISLPGGLVSAGIDVVSMANNHVLDYGRAAFLDTLKRLDAAGVAHAGAGANSASAAAPALLITPSGTVAVLAFTEIIPGGFEAGPKQPGTNPAIPDYKKMLSSIKAAAARADFVVVSMHWGIEYTAQANAGQRALAHQIIDAGADLVIGHHPHVIQGIELYRNKLIAYSLGDFVFDHNGRATGEAFVLRASLPQTGLPSLEIVPVYLNDLTGVPAPVTGEDADAILGRLTKLSASLGLKLVQEGDRAKLAGDPVVTP